MPPSGKQTSDRSRRATSKESDEEEAPPSCSLWVGNLTLDTTEADLTALFSKYGALDSVTTYPSRNYAFLYFKHLDDAKAAKDTLQGALVRGNSIRIEFAKPAKPSKHLWIGGISSTVTKKELEDEFSNFGEIQEFKLLKDRSSAFVDYYKVEDATEAMKNMNGKSFGGEQIRVDFVRSQPSRRDWSDYHDSWMPPDSRNFSESSQHGNKRPPLHGGRREGQPSKVLWIRYPPAVLMDEQMLHNAMILFGEIERIKTFPARHYSFVEFRSIEEAWRAKEGLQGRLFGDPRIQIMFSNSDLAPHKDSSPFFSGARGPPPDMFFNDPAYAAGEFFAPGHSMGPNSFAGPLPPTVRGSNIPMRPFAPQVFDPIHGGSEFSDTGGLRRNFSDGNPMSWRRLSPPAPGILQSPPGMRPPLRALQGAWDEFDARDLKRSRIEGPSLIDDGSFHARRIDNQGIGDPYGLPQPNRGILSPIRMKGPAASLSGHDESYGAQTDHCWRGLIAKGGTPVCHARCLPIGKGLDSPLPEVVNCSARTGLDMLAKHYAEASGFDIVFFLPDSEEDFASYTEFLRYLGVKNRAGVAKFDDGTTLFLVPPSDFLTKTLNVSGPERLYGVVLKLPQQSAGINVPQPQAIPPPPPPGPPPSQYIDKLQLPPRSSYGFVPQNEEQSLSLEYNRSSREDLMSRAGGVKPLLQHAEEPRATGPVSLGYVSNPSANPQANVSLTPELLASLATLVPNGIQSAATGNVHLPLNPSLRPHSFTASVDQEQLHHSSQHMLHQFSNYNNNMNVSDQSAQQIPVNVQIQDTPVNMQHSNDMATRPMSNYVYPSQGGHYSATPGNQQYQHDASYSSHKSYGMAQRADVDRVFNSAFQQSVPSASSAQDHSGHVAQPQSVLPLATDKVQTELPTQLQQLQTALSSSAQGAANEADKNQRYQSTLQFAASLLLQIQQQQQQSSGQSAQGSGNQQ